MKRFLILCCLVLNLGRTVTASGASAETVNALIHEAGSTHDEGERFRVLKRLDGRPDLAPVLRADLAKILPIIDDWANGKSKPVVDTSRAAENGYLCHFITSGNVQPAERGPIYPPELSLGSPLYPIWAFYRARMLLWRVIQARPLRIVDETRQVYYGEAIRLLEVARQAFPENRLIRMYLGETIPWPKSYLTHARAPVWANLQREGLEKLTDIIHWWIDERQLADGQFGGGWGDDVEMWRWWIPVMVPFDDPKIRGAQERISRGMFSQPHMEAGFTSRLTDVEHSTEDSTDTILPMMHLEPDNPLWQQRALRLAELMRERWTGRNERGFRQFRSIYFSVDTVDKDSERAFDTVYHPRTVQPALLLWQRTGNAELGKLFSEWLDLWVDATARADNGKPAGVLPSAIHWPDGGIGKPGQPWWAPFSPGHNDGLYNWPGPAVLMASTLLLAGHMLEDRRYYEPILSMATIRARHREDLKDANAAPGSAVWCAQQMESFMPDLLAKYQAVTGDMRFASQLREEVSGYAQYKARGDTKGLIASFAQTAEAFRSNWEGYTSEARWTDRILAFSSHYLSYLRPPAPPSPQLQSLYSATTGDTGNPMLFPLNHVRWLTGPRDLAALVTAAGRDRFEAELFHFGDGPRRMGAEFYLLQTGDYEFTLETKAGGQSISRQAFKRVAPRTRVTFELPAGELCVVRVRKL
ncbi:MAG: hypothetical protein EXS38_12135 [Opitutus sp.]|nr:hypothetical protein [Opitutus sp.]